MSSYPEFMRRMRHGVLSVLDGLAGAVFSVVVLIFLLASVCGRAGKVIGCVAGWGDDEPEIAMRELDPTSTADQRIFGALRNATEAAGLEGPPKVRAVVVSDVVNAAVLPGPEFVLFEGLWDIPPTALDVIAAHEAAHASGGHAEELALVAKRTRIGTSLIGAFLGFDEIAREEATSWLHHFTLPRYSQDQELEADARAVEILSAMGYGRDATDTMIGGLMWLRSQAGEAGGGYFSSHPALSERITRLRESRGPGPGDAVESALAQAILRAEERGGAGRPLRELGAAALFHMSDDDLLRLAALKAEMAKRASTPICAGLLLEDPVALRAAFSTLGQEEVREFGAILERGVDAALDGRPRREIPREAAREAYRLALLQLSDADRQTLVRIADAEERAAEDLCWATRTLYSLVTELEDRALAATFAIALTEMQSE